MRVKTARFILCKALILERVGGYFVIRAVNVRNVGELIVGARFKADKLNCVELRNKLVAHLYFFGRAVNNRLKMYPFKPLFFCFGI